jgi:hypothetical protein
MQERDDNEIAEGRKDNKTSGSSRPNSSSPNSKLEKTSLPEMNDVSPHFSSTNELGGLGSAGGGKGAKENEKCVLC